MENKPTTRLKHRLTRFFRGSALLRSTCAPAEATSAEAPAEPVFIPGPRHGPLLDRSLSFPSPQHRTRHLPSFDCGGCRPALSPPAPPPPPPSAHAKANKKERRVTETGTFYETGEREGRTCPPASPISPSENSCYYHCFDDDNNAPRVERMMSCKKTMVNKKKFLSNSYGFSSSSSSEGGFFSSDDDDNEGGGTKDEELETLFSSKSFSSDSSEFYRRPKKTTKAHRSSKHKANRLKKNSALMRCGQRKRRNHSSDFRPLVSAPFWEDESEKEKGFAVVKRSRDPYRDFRRSMVEMIMERQMFGPRDLEKLLQSYLCLNSQHHHPVILQAFSDIWETLFSNS